MTRVVVIGDSQAGAFKEGWDAVASRYPDLRMEVFAAPHPHFSRLRLTPKLVLGFPPAADAAGRELVERINGRASIALGDADVVVWAGYRTGFDVIAQILAEADVDGLRAVGAPQLMSEAAFAAVAESLARRFVPAPPWGGWPRPRLVLAARPLPAEGCRASANPRFALWRTLADKPQGMSAALERYDDEFARALAARGVALLPQPRQTITPDLLTGDAFSRGSRRVVNAALHPGTDYIHMNADYGKACIDALVARLPALTGAPHPVDA